MNKKQWYVLAWSCMIIGILFMSLDLKSGFLFGNPCLDSDISSLNIQKSLSAQLGNETITYEEYMGRINELEKLDKYGVMCIVRGEIYAPFIFLFYFLWVVFMIIGWLEKK